MRRSVAAYRTWQTNKKPPDAPERLDGLGWGEQLPLSAVGALPVAVGALPQTPDACYCTPASR
jgi:hypothetical protein